MPFDALLVERNASEHHRRTTLPDESRQAEVLSNGEDDEQQRRQQSDEDRDRLGDREDHHTSLNLPPVLFPLLVMPSDGEKHACAEGEHFECDEDNGDPFHPDFQASHTTVGECEGEEFTERWWPVTETNCLGCEPWGHNSRIDCAGARGPLPRDAADLSFTSSSPVEHDGDLQGMFDNGCVLPQLVRCRVAHRGFTSVPSSHVFPRGIDGLGWKAGCH